MSLTVTKYKAFSSSLHLGRALLVPLVLLGLPVSVVVVMTLDLTETSTGLTSLAHHLLSDPRIMKLMLPWNLSTTRLRPFLLLKVLGRTLLVLAVTWDSATQNGAAVGQDVQGRLARLPGWAFQNQFPLIFRMKRYLGKNCTMWNHSQWMKHFFSASPHPFSSYS